MGVQTVKYGGEAMVERIYSAIYPFVSALAM